MWTGVGGQGLRPDSYPSTWLGPPAHPLTWGLRSWPLPLPEDSEMKARAGLGGTEGRLQQESQ